MPQVVPQESPDQGASSSSSSLVNSLVEEFKKVMTEHADEIDVEIVSAARSTIVHERALLSLHDHEGAHAYRFIEACISHIVLILSS